jgi:hypothetical protein
MVEIDDETSGTSAFVSSIQGAARCLQELRRELPPSSPPN